MKKPIPAPKKTRLSETTHSDVIEDGRLKAPQAIPSLEKCIQGSQVNLETASEFSKKSWRIYSQLVGDHVRQTSTDRYELSDHLLRTTRNNLGHLSEDVRAQRIRSFKAADILAAALCRAAQEVGPPPEEPDEDYWVAGEPIWGVDHPISEAWAELGPQKVPWDVEASLRFDLDSRKWVVGPHRLGVEIYDTCGEDKDASTKTDGIFFTEAPPAPDHTDPSVVRIVRTFEKQKTLLPKLTIEVEGAPVCLLMKAFNLQVRGETVPKDSEELWNSIVRWLAVTTGIKRARPGRPPTGLGREAAFLYDHLKLQWSTVARKLCKEKHNHGRICKDNFRKQAEQYWKRLEDRVRSAK